MLYSLFRKRNNKTNDYIKKTARYIINYCIENSIGTVVCGYNGDFKRSMNLGKKTNYNPKQPYQGKFSGKRIKRGLYRFANGQTANADVNGAANILRKSKQNFDFEELCKGLLDSPLRIRIA